MGTSLESASARRARSVTPGRISLTKLVNRISFKLANRAQESSDHNDQSEKLRRKVEQKHAKAELNRKDAESSRKDFNQRAKEKQAEVRERQVKKKEKSTLKFTRKLVEAQEVITSAFQIPKTIL